MAKNKRAVVQTMWLLSLFIMPALNMAEKFTTKHHIIIFLSCYFFPPFSLNMPETLSYTTKGRTLIQVLPVPNVTWDKESNSVIPGNYSGSETFKCFHIWSMQFEVPEWVYALVWCKTVDIYPFQELLISYVGIKDFHLSLYYIFK